MAKRREEEGGQAHRKRGTQEDRHTGREAHRRTGTQEERHTGGQAHRRTGTQEERHTGGRKNLGKRYELLSHLLDGMVILHDHLTKTRKMTVPVACVKREE